MKSYFIFAIILTAIYVVYYAANIARDLYRKRSQGRTDEEVFELDPDDGQDSVAVTESETGFNVGTEKYETAFDNSGTSIQDGAADTDKESAEEVCPYEGRSRGENGGQYPLPVRGIHSGRYVQGDGFRRPSGEPSRNGVETDGQNLAMKTKKTVCALLMLTVPCFAFAKSGAVNYSWGADALATMHDFVVTMMMYVLYICYAVASVLAVISALQIYIKWNTGEDGIVKSILMLFGSCMFIIGASIVFPAFFGYRI